MKIENAIAFTDAEATTIQVRFKDSREKTASSAYTFRALKSLTEFLTLGAQVVVDTQYGLKVGEVTRIDEEPDIELESDISYRWAFAIVRTDTLDCLKERDDVQIKAVKLRQREAMRKQISAMLESDEPIKALKSLEVSQPEKEPVHIPSRTGEPWTPTEEHRLRREYSVSDRSEEALANIAIKFGRTKGGIVARLEKLGVNIEDQL